MNGREKFLVFAFVAFEFYNINGVDCVVDARNHLLELVDFALKLAYLLTHFLCVVGIVPESFGVLFLLEFCDSRSHFLGIYGFVGTHHLRAHLFKLVSRFVVI